MSLAITDDHKALAGVVASFAADHELHRFARSALESDAPVLPDA
jgi:hypothetical protein